MELNTLLRYATFTSSLPMAITSDNDSTMIATVDNDMTVATTLGSDLPHGATLLYIGHGFASRTKTFR